MTAMDRVQVDEASGASSAEAIGAIVAIVLTILGLAHVAPTWLVAIATIAIGVSIGFQGMVIVKTFAGVLSQSKGLEVGGGGALAIEFLAGAAGIVLGILALLNVDPADLVAIAAIGFGGALVLSSGSAAQLNVLKLATPQLDDTMRRLAGGIASGAAGVQAVSGLAAIVLGILALAGFSPVVLVLIALLELGSFVLVNGSVGSGTLMNMLHR